MKISEITPTGKYVVLTDESNEFINRQILEKRDGKTTADFYGKMDLDIKVIPLKIIPLTSKAIDKLIKNADAVDQKAFEKAFDEETKLTILNQIIEKKLYS